MDRILEPELMEESEQSAAYANADFEQSHQRMVELFEELFGGVEIKGEALDLGCGPGDVTLRFARRFPGLRLLGVDGAAAMLDEGRKRLTREAPDVAARIEFTEGVIPGAAIPRRDWALVLSTSFLHHLHRPGGLWDTICEQAVSGSHIFVADLMRPPSQEEAWRIVDTYSGDEPEVLKRDFFNSLCAAFRPDEVEAQLAAAGLGFCRVRVFSDRHWAAWGACP
jgi:SAM-dependent methyltransferase